MQDLHDFTTRQLDQAAWDLRNAGLVVDTLGQTRGTLIDYTTARVCAAGAIDLATFRKLRYIGHPFRIYDTAEFGDEEKYRAEIAYTVFAAFVPTQLCEKCDYDRVCDKPLCRPPTCDHVPGDLTPWERVVHYNDAHCTGGTLLVNMLALAADRAEIVAGSMRRLLAGSLLERI